MLNSMSKQVKEQESATSKTARVSLTNFLHRQNTMETLRRDRLEILKSEQAPTLQPELCERSRMLAERWCARQAEAVDGKSDSVLEQDCLFAPTINKISQKRKSRGCKDMSAGDQARREASIVCLREQAEEQESDVVRFEPRSTDDGAGCWRRILKDRDAYLAHVDRTRKKNFALNEEMQQAEFERTCTFKPHVRPAPVFVRRMAESHRLVREKNPEVLVGSGAIITCPLSCEGTSRENHK